MDISDIGIDIDTDMHIDMDIDTDLDVDINLHIRANIYIHIYNFCYISADRCVTDSSPVMDNPHGVVVLMGRWHALS